MSARLKLRDGSKLRLNRLSRSALGLDAHADKMAFLRNEVWEETPSVVCQLNEGPAVMPSRHVENFVEEYFVASDDDGPVAYMCVLKETFNDEDGDGKCLYSLMFLYVAPRMRNRGVATALARTLQKVAESNDLCFKVCVECNHRGIEFFTRIGFAYLKETPPLVTAVIKKTYANLEWLTTLGIAMKEKGRIQREIFQKVIKEGADLAYKERQELDTTRAPSPRPSASA